MKYGYAIESSPDQERRIITPPDLTKIRLTPTNAKFVFQGTRNDILEWMLRHEGIVVEYDPTDGIDSPPISPTLSPLGDLLSPDADKRSSISSTVSTASTASTSSTRGKKNNITFDLFGQQIKNTLFRSDDVTYYRPLQTGLNYIPFFDVILEIRPTDPAKDKTFDPVNRLVLPSGLTLYEVSKALEKSWRNILPQSLGLFQRPPPTDYEGTLEVKADSDYVIEKNPFLDWLASKKATTFPTPSSFVRWQQKKSVIPPGVLTPYNTESVVGDDVMISKPEETARERKEKEQKEAEERERQEQLYLAGLPRYEKSNEDQLLEESGESSNSWANYS